MEFIEILWYRRTQLPPSGCKYCSCHGCNPIDIRRDKRNEARKYINKNKRITFDSDDEDIELQNEYDKWHMAKRELEQALINLTGLSEIALIGLGFPKRTPSYIL
jgi:hypothetical protein